MSDEAKGDKEFRELDVQKSTELLQLGLTKTGRPVDALADRLERRDGGEWFARLVSENAVPALSKLVAPLAKGDASLDDLIALKDECKVIVKGGKDQDVRLAGVAGYFLAIAGALVAHGKLISSHRMDDLAAAFLDLASVSPEEWEALLTEAAWACRNSERGRRPTT